MADAEELDDLIALCGRDSPIVTLQPGETLFKEGDDADAMYIVKTGTLRILSGNTIFENLGAGGIVGEMGIIEENTPRSATVIARTRCELIEIDCVRFLALVADMPSFALTVMRIMAHRLRVMNRRYRTTARI